MKAEKIATIYRTNDYGAFKKLDGNREITDAKIARIKKSIEKVGYVMSPICVNEKREIVDGQTRFGALKELNMPVDFYVVNGAGIEECRAMNINQGNWKTEDYIKSYADMGDISYQYLWQAYSKYRRFGVSVVCLGIKGALLGSKDLQEGRLLFVTI